MIILSLQLIGGVVIDKLFDPSRTKTPLTDKLHWWGGRLSVLGGIVNVFLGLVLYNAIFTASATSVFIIIVSIFLVVIVAFFAIAQRLMGQSHDNASEEKGFEMKDY
jgi:protein-S-isoprenylcysteine O-methyltransferase Ste14